MSGGYEDDDELVPVSGGRARKPPDDGSAAVPDDAGDRASLDRQLANQPCTDIGNSNRYIFRFGEDFRYVQEVGWHWWDKTRWAKELGQIEAERHAQKIPAAIWKEWRALKEDPGERDAEGRLKALASWANESGNSGKLSAMLKVAAPHLTLFARDLDCDHHLLAAPNGTLELSGLSGGTSLRAAKRVDFITRRLGVAYKPGGDCPLFRKFLNRIMPDEAMRGFVQRILGYCLSGSTREHKIFIFYGTGRNGKSTLLDVMREILGDYAMTSPVALFMAQQHVNADAPSSAMARLSGPRLVTAAEPPEGARLDEAKIKEISGGEQIDARFLNKEHISFKPRFKLVISTNHQPAIRGTDQGIWSRILMVPFTVEIPDNEIDRDLSEKLKLEAAAILNWLIEGYEEYRQIGLAPPDAAIAAKEDYRADQDPVGEFMKACCVVTGEKLDPSSGRPYEVTAASLLGAYKKWCEREGLEPLSAKSFGGKLTARGIKRRKSDDMRLYVGLVVKASALV